jgi:hypothetical protein
MKRIFMALLLLTVLLIDVHGQWYYKKYGVADINGLTNSQLEESKKESGYNLIVSAGVAGIGGLLIWGGKSTLRRGLDEDATFIEELLGAKFLGNTYIILGYGCIAGGAIGSIVFFTRHERIRSVLHRNYDPVTSLSISPSVITTTIMNSSAIGVTATLKF